MSLIFDFSNFMKYLMPATYVKIVFFSLELSWCVHLGSAYLLNGHFNIVHPLNHFWISGVIYLLNKGVIFLPKRHFMADVNLEDHLLTSRKADGRVKIKWFAKIFGQSKTSSIRKLCDACMAWPFKFHIAQKMCY